MCRRIIEHWSPCNHQKLFEIKPCVTATSTPGQRYEHCPNIRNSYPEEPSSTPCPDCKKTFRARIRDKGISIPTPSVSLVLDLRTPTKPSSEPSTFICEIGEHQLVDMDDRGLGCMLCGTIRRRDSLEPRPPCRSDIASPLLSLFNDDDGVVTPRVSTATEFFDAPDNATASGDAIRSHDRTQSEQVDDRANEAGASSANDSTAQADASWRLYEAQLDRRMKLLGLTN